MATRKVTKTIGEMFKLDERRAEEIERRRAETRLMCIPGIMPEMQPQIIPASSPRMSSSSMN